MARRKFDVVDVTEILIHWYAGRSRLELSATLDVDRKTIMKYLEREPEGLVPGRAADQRRRSGEGEVVVPAAG